MNKSVLAAAGLAVALSGCATVTRGTKEMWYADSRPGEATVRTDHGHQCRTPCWLKLPRKDEFGVTVSKQGYKDFQTRVLNSIAAGGGVAMAGNVIAGGLIGVGVDALSGATLSLYPNPLVVILEPVGSSEESHLDPNAPSKPPKPPKQR